MQALAAAVQDGVQNGGVDPARVYLAGRGEAAAAALYTIARIPDLWAAGLLVGGSPQPAIDSGRVFAANFTNVPVLWVSGGATDQELAAKLKSAGLNLEWRSATGLANATIFDWLAAHKREPFPSEVDCETDSPAFARCYWVQMAQFDVNERNDVLPSTVVRPGSAAALDLGPFAFKNDDPGPGVLVELPEKYSGPLKTGDRLMAFDGREIANARQYVERLAAVSGERPVVVTVQRGKDRVRLETRFTLPRRGPNITARVEAQYLPADKEIQIVSRTVKELRVTIPPEWAMGSRLYWNGLVLEKVDAPGCFVLTVEKELLHAARCP